MEQTDRSKLAAVGVGIGLVSLAVGFGALGSVVTWLVIDAVGLAESTFGTLVMIRGLQYGLLALAVTYLATRGFPSPFLRVGAPGPEGIAWMILIPLALIAFGTALEPVFRAAGLESEVGGPAVDPTATIGLFLVFFVVSWLVAAPAEELLFRGVIQGRLRESFGAVPGVLVAAALFSLFHVLLGVLEGLSVAGIAYWGIETFAGGLAFGAAYERTNTLVVPSVAHASMWTLPYFIF